MERKAVTPDKLKAAYRLCLKRERDRERIWRKTQQGEFESEFLHHDFDAEESRERQTSLSWLSDRGRGAEAIGCFDDQEPPDTRQKCINRARMAISRNLPDCLKTFWLVVKNGNNREESIWEIMKTTSRQHPNGEPQKPSTLHNSKKC